MSIVILKKVKKKSGIKKGNLNKPFQKSFSKSRCIIADCHHSISVVLKNRNQCFLFRDDK